MADHGRPARYNAGCRCDACRAANTARYKRYREQPGVIEAERVRQARRRKEKPEQMRAARFRRAYGITLKEFDAMLAAQDGACAICRATDFGDGKNAVCLDHDHATGKLRAILCRLCNVGLGAFRDSPELLREAAIYVSKHREDDQ